MRVEKKPSESTNLCQGQTILPHVSADLLIFHFSTRLCCCFGFRLFLYFRLKSAGARKGHMLLAPPNV